MIQLKTLNKRIATKSQGVFYKPVVNEENKEVDKVYLIKVPIGKQAMSKLFNAGLKTTDRKNCVVVHSLRHTFASHLALKGASIHNDQKSHAP